MRAKIDDLESQLNAAKIEIENLKSNLENLGVEKRQESETNEREKSRLREQIERLEEEVARMQKANATLESEIEALKKEKSFIINQNEHQHKIVLGDYLSQQEKLTDLSYQINKLTAESDELRRTSDEARAAAKAFETQLVEVNLKLKMESGEKNEAIHRAQQLESKLDKVFFKFIII